MVGVPCSFQTTLPLTWHSEDPYFSSLNFCLSPLDMADFFSHLSEREARTLKSSPPL